MKNKRILITGAGQDALLLESYLVKNGYTDVTVTSKISLDIRDRSLVKNCIQFLNPDFIINFAAISSPTESKENVAETFTVNLNAIIYQLDAIKDFAPNCRFFNAGSVLECDKYFSKFEARTPYAMSKLAAHQIIKFYRDHYNLYAVQGILGLHESKQRTGNFLIKRIVEKAEQIKNAINNRERFTPLEVYDAKDLINVSRAEDVVISIWEQMQKDKPEDFILRNNHSVTIAEIIEKAFDRIGVEGYWSSNQYIIPSYVLDGSDIKSGVLAVSKPAPEIKDDALDIPNLVIYTRSNIEKLISELI